MKSDNFSKKLVVALAFFAVQVFSQNSFTDNRDGKKYKAVKIGEQVWMAENLNYNAESSRCYDNSFFYCNEYGRLYTWEAAKKACPAGWHLPSDVEWITLISFVGDTISYADTAMADMVRFQYERAGIHADVEPKIVKFSDAGIKLKAVELWERYSGKVGSDNFGFAALPCGFGHLSDEKFQSFKSNGLWWSSKEYNERGAFYVEMTSRSSDVHRNNGGKLNLFSVRCIQD